MKKNENLLKQNFDDWVIQSILESTKEESKPILAWKFIGEQKISFRVRIKILRKLKNEFILCPLEDKHKDGLKSLSSGATKLNFFLSKDLILFQTDVKEVGAGGDIRVEIPSMIAQVERRKSLRLTQKSQIDVEVEFLKEGHFSQDSKQSFKKTCLDFSSGGCAFVVSKGEKNFFKMKDNICSITYRFEGQVVCLDAKVVSVRAINPNARNQLTYKGWKISLEHQKIDDLIIDMINDFVFRHLEFDLVV